MERLAVPPLVRGADRDHVCLAAGATGQGLPGSLSVQVTVEMVQDQRRARRARFRWPGFGGAAEGDDQAQQGHHSAEDEEDLAHEVRAALRWERSSVVPVRLC
jgi:hypothetical protein